MIFLRRAALLLLLLLGARAKPEVVVVVHAPADRKLASRLFRDSTTTTTTKLVEHRTNRTVPTKFAALLVGHVRTGRFRVVSENIAAAILAPLGSLDVFAVPASDDAPWTPLALAWRAHVREWHVRSGDVAPARCGAKVGGHTPGLCWPWHPQFFKLATAVATLEECERPGGKKYEWVLRVRTDVVYRFALPPSDWWKRHRRAAYADSVTYPRKPDGSAVIGATAWECKSVRDLFAVVHRDYASAYFSNFAKAYTANHQRCEASWQCPRCVEYFRDDPSEPLAVVTRADGAAQSWHNPDALLGAVLSDNGRLRDANGRVLSEWRRTPVVALHMFAEIISCGDPRVCPNQVVHLARKSKTPLSLWTPGYSSHGPPVPPPKGTSKSAFFSCDRQPDPRCDAPFSGKHRGPDHYLNVLNASFLPVAPARKDVLDEIAKLDFDVLRRSDDHLRANWSDALRPDTTKLVLLFPSSSSSPGSHHQTSRQKNAEDHHGATSSNNRRRSHGGGRGGSSNNNNKNANVIRVG
mmetsp:Transcript_1642/g.4899  ORF Transcript_1642/g.4899 Transcript_1642/m.4899 type:complete len:523 (-) Transcript_1642:362-1930(-)